MAFDSDKAAQAADAAEADLKGAADKVASVNREVEQILADVYATEDEVAGARLVVQADDAARRLVLANAEYDKQVQVASILRAVATLRKNADTAAARGDTAGAQKYLRGAEDTAKVLKGFKVAVTVPPRDPEVEKLSGALAGLNATGDLAGFFDKIGRAVKKATTAVTNVKKVVGKVEQAAKYVQKNGAKIGAVAGTIATAIPVVGPVVGPAIMAGGALLQATAPKPKPPADPGAEATVVVDPSTGLPLPTDVQGNPVPPAGKRLVFDARTGQPVLVPVSTGLIPGVSNNALLLGVGGAVFLLGAVFLITRRPALAPRAA